LPSTDAPLIAECPDVTTARCEGTETILLVEDEEAVRMLAKQLLERKGYNVIAAADSEEAIECAVRAESKQPIHLLIADVVMPGKSGPELFSCLHDLLPDLKVLYISGYTNDAIVKRGLIDSSTPFMQKPFSSDTLGRKVREVLQAVPTAA
jgi:DNA-binding NtrC family response regulator